VKQRAILVTLLALGWLFEPILAFGEPPDDPFVSRDHLYVEQLEAMLREKSLLSRTWRSYRSYPLIQRAEALTSSGREEDAIAEYGKLIARDPDQLIARWHQLVLLSKLGNQARAIKAATALIERAPEFAPAYLHRAMAERAEGSNAKARANLETALRVGSLAPIDQAYAQRTLYDLFSIDSAKSREQKAEVAVSLAKLADAEGDLPEEAIWLARAFDLDPHAEAGFSLARTLMEQDKPGLAVPVLEEVAATTPDGSKEQIHSLASLGFAAAESGNYEDAAAAWQNAGELSGDPVFSLRVAWALRRAGQPEEAARVLSKVEVSQLPEADHATWYEERAALSSENASDEEGLETVLALRRMALRLNPTVANRYSLVLTLYRSDRNEEAAEVVGEASPKDLENVEFLALAGHVERRVGNFSEAVDYWRQALALDPDQIGVREDLAYVYMRNGQNKEAAQTFREALDFVEAWPNQTEPDRLRKTEKEIRFRRQIQILEKSWGLFVYDSYSPSEVNTTETGAILGVPSSAAFGTIQAFYRPPVIGYWDGRIVEITGRVFAANKNKSPVPDLDTLQGAIGFRAKPFKTQNFWIGVERFFEIGDQTQDNTLLRAAWSYTSGNDWLPLIDTEENTVSNPLYLNFYVDAAQFLELTKNTLFYAEGRIGKTFRIRSNILASPFVYVLGNGNFSTVLDAVASEAGGGVVVRLATWESADYGPRLDIQGLLRVGHELQNNQADTESRVLIGLQLGY